MTSGVRVRETSVATRSPTAGRAGTSGPTSSTVPTSMPPEPVSGFCILPRVATMSRTAGPDRRRRRRRVVCVRSSWRYDAASRLSRSTRIRTSSGHSSRRVSRRWAAWGRTPGRRGPGAGRSGRCPAAMAAVLSVVVASDGKSAASHWTGRTFSSYLAEDGASHTTERAAAASSTNTPSEDSMSIETASTRDRGRLRPALPLPPRRAGRAGLDPLPGLAGRHRRGVGVGAVAARALRQERPPAARADGRPPRRARSTPTSSATRPSGPPCRCWCRRR